jgi:hypothetical protein
MITAIAHYTAAADAADAVDATAGQGTVFRPAL